MLARPALAWQDSACTHELLGPFYRPSSLVYLLLGDDYLTEVVLEMFMGKVNTELLQTVHFKFLWIQRTAQTSLISASHASQEGHGCCWAWEMAFDFSLKHRPGLIAGTQRTPKSNRKLSMVSLLWFVYPFSVVGDEDNSRDVPCFIPARMY